MKDGRTSGTGSAVEAGGLPLPAAAALVFLVAVGVFAGSLGHGFSTFDDPTYVTANPQVLQGLTGDGMAWALRSTAGGGWHPVTWLSHMAVVSIAGTAPWAHHLANLILHGAAAALFFLALAWATGSSGRSALAALLFAVHPLRVESVVWVAERKDVLSGCLWSATLAAYVWYARRPTARRLAVPLGLFAVGLLSKSMLVTLPAVLLLLDYWPLGRMAGRQGGWANALRGVRRLVLEKVPFLLLAAGAAVAAVVAQDAAGGLRSLGAMSLADRVGNALVSVVRYLAKTVWPAGLSVYYPFPQGGWGLPAVAGALILVAGVSAVLIARANRREPQVVGWFWFLITLAPVIGIVQIGSQAMADRYTYIPSMGLAIALAWLLPDRLPGSARVRVGIATGASLVLLLLAVATVRQTALWRGDIPLFSHALAVTRANWMANVMLGSLRSNEGKTAAAEGHYRDALRDYPGLPEALCGLAAVLAEQGRTDEARAAAAEAVVNNPRMADGHFILGNLSAAEGRTKEAIASYRRAVRADPGLADVRLNLGNALILDGSPGEAVPELLEANRLGADSRRVNIALGVAYELLGRFPEAVEALERVVSADPGNPMIRYRLAIAAVRAGRRELALRELAALDRLHPPTASQLRRFLEQGDGAR